VYGVFVVELLLMGRRVRAWCLRGLLGISGSSDFSSGLSRRTKINTNKLSEAAIKATLVHTLRTKGDMFVESN